MSSQIRVGVLRGGPSQEYDISLKTGAEVLQNLPKEKYQTVDILVDQSGEWHVGGLIRQPDDLSNLVDVVWNALHGAYGEDGKVQQILEAHKISYTGSDILASALGMNKELSKEVVKKSGIKSPYHRLITREEYEASSPHELFRSAMMPVVIKILDGGSSLGVSFAGTPEELWEGIDKAFNFGDTVMLEQHIRGREATVGVIDDFRGKKRYALIPVEIDHGKSNSVWGYEDKYSGLTKEYCPGRFSEKERKTLENMAVLAHEAIGARHYSRSDFIVSPRGVYFLEINTLPGLTKESLIPKALDAIGVKLPHFLDHIISLALGRK